MKIKSILLVCHPSRDILPPILNKLISTAVSENLKVYMLPKAAKQYNHSELALLENKVAQNIDMLVVLGGDGTMLGAVRTFASSNIPVIGVNLGHIGFLTAEEAANANNAIKQIKEGKYSIEKRMMIETEVYRDNKKVFSGCALNDIVIQKEPMLRIIDLEVYVKDTLVNIYHGDGLVFSTPTGSTAYSLSAGGPIVTPNMELFILCPLNNHTLSARPIIAPSTEAFSTFVKCSHSHVTLVLDGQESYELKDGDNVIIKKASSIAKIVTLNNRNFYKLIKDKLLN